MLSYSIQMTINEARKFLGPLFFVLQESEGQFGPIVMQKLLKKQPHKICLSGSLHQERVRKKLLVNTFIKTIKVLVVQNHFLYWTNGEAKLTKMLALRNKILLKNLFFFFLEQPSTCSYWTSRPFTITSNSSKNIGIFQIPQEHLRRY